VTLRSGADHYTFEFIVNANKIADGTFISYSDSATGANTADAATALAQFFSKRPCYTDPLYSSGYLVPAGFLTSSNITRRRLVGTTIYYLTRSFFNITSS
jgi:hypothetical protein